MTWLILGIFVGAGFVFLAHRQDIQLAWYDWIILAVAVVFFLLAIANFSQSRAELEPRAANILLVAFGVPGLLCTGIVAVRVWRNMQNALTE